ncbi:MAG TPA: ComF family protein [Verrucomicrobiae bacterium]|nr:ComF family protein [Verrucomicrobiae bacterium]
MSAALGRVLSWARVSLSLLYPDVCQICNDGRAGPAEGYVCGSCRSSVRFIEPPFCDRCGLPFEGAITNAFECGNCKGLDLQFSRARSAVLARDAVREAIHSYKYHRALWFEPFLGGLLTERAAGALNPADWHFIVPVPLHPKKEREREFNQARRLAGCLGRATGIPVRADLLRRVLPTRTQTQLSREERRTNMRNAFRFSGARPLNGEKIVVVDDVLTTGATTSACARVLRKAGASEVCVWTVARGT